MRSMPLLSLLTFLLSCGIAFAEDLPTTPVARAALVPTGWQVEAEASGDLDADGRLDLAMVLVREGVDLSIKDKTAVGPRRLVIAFGTEDGFERVINNNQLIPPADDPDMEDVFDGLKIAEGNLVLDLRLFAFAGGWSMWRKSFTFQWQDGAFALVLFDWTDVNRGTGQLTITTTDYAAKTVTTRHGSISTDVETSQTETLPTTNLTTLDDIVDGLAFEP